MQLFSRGKPLKIDGDSHLSARRLMHRLRELPTVHSSNRCQLLLQAVGKGSGGGGRSGSKSKGNSSSSKGNAGFGGGRGGGGRSAGRSGGRTSSSRTADVPEQPQRSYITSPVQVELLEELTKTEFTEAPKWETWCNLMSGEWVGVYAAYTPWAGLSEAVWMDERGKYIHTVLTRCLEEKGQGALGSSDESGQQEPLLLRKLARATTPASLKEIAINPSRRTSASAQSSRAPSTSGQPTGSTQSSSAAAGPCQEASEQQQQQESVEEEEEESVEVEALSYNSEGVVVFDGGHYSAGPEYVEKKACSKKDHAVCWVCVGDLQCMATLQDSQRIARVHRAFKHDPWHAVQAGPPTFKMLQEDDGDGPEDEGEGEQGTAAAPTTTSIFETCLVDWSTRSRVRLKLTLRIGHAPDNEEVEVQVLRMVLFRECWAGPPGLTHATDIEGCLSKLAGHNNGSSHNSNASQGQEAGTSQKGNGVPLAAATREMSKREELKAALKDPEHAARAVPESWQGEWSVFTVTATAIEENDIMTGEPIVTWVYMTNEDKQAWQASSAPPTGDAGGALWLPGGVVCTISMVDYTQGNDADEDDDAMQQRASSNGTTPPARGLRLGMSWQLPSAKGQVLSVERDYDGAGMLRGVRYSTAVKGGWSGGKM